MNAGCRIGKIRMKNGGAEIRVIPTSNHSLMAIQYSWGEVTFRMYDGERIERRDALYLLRCAEEDILRGQP